MVAGIRRIGVAARYSDLVILGDTAYFSGYVPEASAGREYMKARNRLVSTTRQVARGAHARLAIRVARPVGEVVLRLFPQLARIGEVELLAGLVGVDVQVGGR